MPETLKQVAEKLNTAASTLIVLAPLPSPDTIAAGLALAGYLKRLEKDAVVVASDGSLDPKMDFLGGYDQVLRDLNISKGFVIEVSTKQTQISELSYKKENDKLAIHLKPKSGQFTKDDISFHESKFPYDVVVTIGVISFEGLGGFYNRHAELFFETPVINIDYRGSNEGFGQYNLVQLNSTSHSEIIFDLIGEMEKELIDEDLATSLLAGIIAETNSFQHSKTTPQAFLKASQLIGVGARQQDIVNRLYKNKSLGFLKLWGRVLARVKTEPEVSLVYSAVNQIDFDKAGAENDDATAVLREMIFQLAFAKIHVFLREISPTSTEVYVSAPAVLSLDKKFAEHNPDSYQPQSLHFKISEPLTKAEIQILQSIREEAKKLSI